jgi:tetratricopeptide (TPR) repeat protein
MSAKQPAVNRATLLQIAGLLLVALAAAGSGAIWALPVGIQGDVNQGSSGTAQGLSTPLPPPVAQALDAINAGQAKDAVTQLRSYAAREPASAPALIVLAIALDRTGDANGAADALRKAAKIAPQSSLLVELGSIAYNDGKPADAARLFRLALVMNPGDRYAHQRLGIVLDDQRDLAGAIREYELGLVGAPREYLGLKIDLASLYNQQRRFGDAIALLAPLVKPNESKDANALVVLGVAYLGARDPDNALAATMAASKLDPDSPSVLLALGAAQRAAKQLDASLATLQKVTASSSDATSARFAYTAQYQLGLTRLARSEYKEAREAFAAASKLAPESREIQHAMGESLLLGGQPDEAIAVFKDLAQRKNAVLGDYIVLATAYQNASRFEDAQRTYRDAVTRFPNDPTAHWRYGTFLALETKYGNAGVALAEGLKIAPDDPRLLQSASLVAVRRGRLPEAIAFAQRLVDLDPKSPSRRFYLGALYEDSGDKTRAMELYRAVIADDPKHALALNNLAALLTETDAKAAVAYARRAVEVMPQSAPVEDTLGWALLKAGQPREAVVALGTAARLQPDDPKAHYRLAIAQKEAGELKAARQSLERALAQKTSFPDAPKAREMLAQLPP